MQKNSEKGFFLVFTLLLSVLVTSSCLVMVQTATMNKSSSKVEIFRTNLENITNQLVIAIAKTLDPTTANGLMSTLETQKANLFLVDLSSGSPVVVCNVTSNALPFACNSASTANPNSISSLSNQFTGTTTPATISLSPAGTSQANASKFIIDHNLTPTITFSQKSYSSNTTTATYGLIIDVQICGTIDSISVCRKATIPTNFTFTRACPNSSKSLDSPGIAMRPLTDAEIKKLYGNQYTSQNTYPNLYCTCFDPILVATNSSGKCLACSGSTSYWSGTSCQTCPSNSICSNGAVTGCQPGYYGASCNTQCQGIISGTWPNLTCQTCPSTAICSNGAISGCQPGYYGASCNTQCQGIISGTWPNLTCQTCPSTAICSNGAISGCQPGYYGTSCNTQCQGIISGTWPNLTCQACPSTAICSNGAISGCQISYYGYTCGSLCQGVVSGSWPSATCLQCSGSTPYWNGTSCATCPVNAICSNGNITGCTSGYYGSTCSTLCTGITSSTWPTTCQTCPVNAICSNGKISGCNSGYYGTNCASLCSAGYLTGTGVTAVCNTCPAGSVCSYGTITGCINGFSLANGVCSCSSGYITGSGSTAVCNACPAGNTCSGGAITGCSNGFSLVNSVCTCSSGYITGSGSTAVCNACPSANTCSGGVITGCCKSGCGYICVCYESSHGYSNLNCYAQGNNIVSINAGTDCNYVCANMPTLGYPWAASGGYPACGGGKPICNNYYSGCLSSPPEACLCPPGTTVKR